MKNVVLDTDTFENFLMETGTEAPVLVREDVVGEIGNLICRNIDG